jgi:hypothetical protein
MQRPACNNAKSEHGPGGAAAAGQEAPSIPISIEPVATRRGERECIS